MNGNASSSAYTTQSVDLWHGRLDHAKFGSIKWFKNMKLISTVNVIRCFVCIQAKYAKKPFKSITSRQTTLLDVVLLDLADFKNTASK